MTPRRKSLTRGLVALGLLAGLGAAAARDDDPLDTLARELVERRAAVERLSADLELKKAVEREELRSAAQQKADIERQVKALELELEDARRAAAERAAALEARAVARAALAPMVKRHLEAAAAGVREGLPFKRAEREAALDDLRRELEAGRVRPDEALARLWSALEDELRLTREVGLHRQRIELDGQTLLADVAKLGMTLMYFRALDGRLGVVDRDARGWRFRVCAPDERPLVGALFDALDKHLRQGFFVLPNPYAGAAPEEAPR